jgi:hypothetical protein
VPYPSELKKQKQDSSSTIVSPYAASSSTSAIDVVSKVRRPTSCSFGLSATSQRYFSPPTNQHQPPSTYQPLFFSHKKSIPTTSHQQTEQVAREKRQEVDCSLRSVLTVDRETYFPHNPASQATISKGQREHITGLPVIPDKAEDAKDVMPVLPINEDNVEETDVPIIPAVLSRLANFCTRWLRRS